jgi:hypothetical protein
MRTTANIVKLFVVTQGVTEKFGQHTETREDVYIHTCPEHVTAERVEASTSLNMD